MFLLWSYESSGRCSWNGAQWLMTLWHVGSGKCGNCRLSWAQWECTVHLVNCWLFSCPAFILCRKRKSEGKIIRIFIFKKGLNYTVKPHYSRIPYLTILLLVQIYCNCIPWTFQILFNVILRCLYAGLQLLGSCLDATPLTLSRLGCHHVPCKQAFCSLSQLSFSPPCC